MGVTIRDVAREAGVSSTTVSRVLNQSVFVNHATRAHVLAVAERLRYVPNAVARSLSMNRTRVLGLVLPCAHSEFFMEMIRGMDEMALEQGYNLLISGSHNRIEDTLQAFRTMKGQVDGFLVVSPNIDLSLLSEALPEDAAAVFLHSSAPPGGHHAIRVANEAGAFQAVRHLVDLGHRRIAFIKGPDINQEVAERLAGYHRALCSAGLAPDPGLVFPGSFLFESGEAAARALLALPDRPTALFACSDLMAIGALRVFRAAGVRVPDDIAVVGFDDIPSARYVAPSLSTVHIPIVGLGRRAVRRLIDLVEQPGVHEPTEEVLETTLVPRASTLGAAYRDDAEAVEADEAAAPVPVGALG